MLFIGGRRHNAEIAKILAEADEQAGKIKEREERMAEIKGRVDQGYKRLCELHPEDAVQTK